jgi:hypothetical protein
MGMLRQASFFCELGGDEMSSIPDSKTTMPYWHMSMKTSCRVLDLADRLWFSNADVVGAAVGGVVVLNGNGKELVPSGSNSIKPRLSKVVTRLAPNRMSHAPRARKHSASTVIKHACM